ncbi:MAG: hypothetical protein FJZ16_06530 [Candidatus Omnitrophica bacterium]|nr:hypothetical protein [Candidatus Omnitrophota bacterium]
MNKAEVKILHLLLNHRGSKSAITVKRIKSKTGIPERTIRQAISNLVTLYYCPIASSVHHPYGFYFITDEKEGELCLGQYWSRISKLLKRIKSLKKAIENEFGKEIQLELNFNNE